MTNRVVFIDYLRVIACFMVMLVHSCEPFYLGGQGSAIASFSDAAIVTAINSMLRASVPLFVLASSYLLFPVRGNVRDFYRRRAARVLPMFLLFLVLYSVIPLYGNTYEFYKADILTSFKQLFFNFPGAAGHLWFVYMLIGVYIVMPIFSPWIEKVSVKGERAFLGIWLFASLVPFLRLLAEKVSGNTTFWGEANWNEFGLLYGVSGFMGYVVLGHYFRERLGELSWKKTLLWSSMCFIAGYAISAGWFWSHTPKDFPYDLPLSVAIMQEVGWGFCSTGTVLQTIAFFLIIRKFNSTGWFYSHVVRPVSEASYEMYLMHIFFLCFYVAVLRDHLASTLSVIFLTAILSFVTSFAVSMPLHKLAEALTQRLRKK